jgi:hypothetical protein
VTTQNDLTVVAVAATQVIWRTAMDQARHAVCQNVTVVAVTLNIQWVVAE